MAGKRKNKNKQSILSKYKTLIQIKKEKKEIEEKNDNKTLFQIKKEIEEIEDNKPLGLRKKEIEEKNDNKTLFQIKEEIEEKKDEIEDNKPLGKRKKEIAKENKKKTFLKENFVEKLNLEIELYESLINELEQLCSEEKQLFNHNESERIDSFRAKQDYYRNQIDGKKSLIKKCNKINKKINKMSVKSLTAKYKKIKNSMPEDINSIREWHNDFVKSVNAKFNANRSVDYPLDNFSFISKANEVPKNFSAYPEGTKEQNGIKPLNKVSNFNYSKEELNTIKKKLLEKPKQIDKHIGKVKDLINRKNNPSKGMNNNTDKNTYEYPYIIPNPFSNSKYENADVSTKTDISKKPKKKVEFNFNKQDSSGNLPKNKH